MRVLSIGMISSALLLTAVSVSSVVLAASDNTMSSAPRAAGGAADMAALDQMTANWPANIKKSVADTVKLYGLPTDIGRNEIAWHNLDMSNTRLSPFKTVRIKNTETPHQFPVPHTDYMKHVVDYRANPDKISALAMYDGSVTYARTRGELSAECDTPGHNILALNLANDVAMGKRSVEDARNFYAQTIAQEMKGEKPAYEQKLMFTPAKAGDADRQMMPKAASMMPRRQ